MRRRRTLVSFLTLFALLAAACSTATSTTADDAATSTSTTTTAPESPEPASPDGILAVGADDAETFRRVLDLIASQGVRWPVNQAEAFDAATVICTTLSDATSVDGLTDVVRGQWSQGQDPSSVGWENLRTIYGAVSIGYCPQWDLLGATVGDSPTAAESMWRSEIAESGLDETAFAGLLLDEHPRSAALVLGHLGESDFAFTQAEFLQAEHPEAAAEIAGAFDELQATQ